VPISFVSFSATPTPFFLPTQTYQRASVFQSLWGQLFNKHSEMTDLAALSKTGPAKITSEHFALFEQNDYLPVDAQWWQQASEKIYAYDSSRMRTELEQKTLIVFLPPQTGNCSPRGTTVFDEVPTILIYADQKTSQEQILATLSHELGHVFIHQMYPNLHSVALNEGMATWIARDYWQAWKNNPFDVSVRKFISNQSYLPLFQNLDMQKAYEKSADCIRNRDILLTEFASFIDYLIRTYGMERLSVLYDEKLSQSISQSHNIHSPDFYGVYGLQLNQLENAWLLDLIK